jgi:glucose/arabinose dehydrogenase
MYFCQETHRTMIPRKDRMMRSLPTLALVLTACLAQGIHAQTLVDPNLIVEEVITGLSLPTGFQFTGPGQGFVIQKNDGRVLRFDGGTTTEALNLAVNSNSERGLLGIEVDPNFAANNFVYLYYSTSTAVSDSGAGNTWGENRLSRFTWNGSSLGSETILATFGKSSDNQANGPNHDGGVLKIGPDGKL